MCQRLPSGVPTSRRADLVNTSSDSKDEPACAAAWTQVTPRSGFQICQGGNDGDNLGGESSISIHMSSTRGEEET